MENKYNAGYIDYISKNEYILNFFNNTKSFIEDINPDFWTDVVNNPSLIAKYPESPDAILLMSSINFLYDIYNFNMSVSYSIEQKIKRKIQFNAASGDNYGLIIPLHFPLGTAGIGAYLNFQLEDTKTSLNYDNDFARLINSIDKVPFPYIYIFGSINCWTAPMSVGLRFAFMPGYNDFYSLFVKDTKIETFGLHAAMDLKFYVYRDNYFFVDARADFNFDYGTFKLGFMNERYMFQMYNSANSTYTGASFSTSADIENKWISFALTPKLVGGLKIKEKIPYIDYFAIYGFIGVDLIYSFIDSKSTFGINSITENINNKTYEFHSNMPEVSIKDNYFSYDIRVGATIDIFYQSLSFEYAIFSKSFSVMFIPFVYRFAAEPKS
ncbi:hypothetical protein BHAMNSH16_04165 [Brachyspira hampsonii]|uniref:Uncharacterized protein n=2 Tax=Brachyspira hampsonii TaxID=1287055 RepID=A0AAC9TUY8_9SPIR|nr:hypothetical protein [Brachyspira hampsonii]ASJ22765.1 hypothetical protein BHAMNSH16_04165 [Brachyspira hampsonii]MBW5380105.1 hypothetical protein [Brachyspira hampsonii]MBW5410669.1 hypothetical protein [Brachyspira hampsonii]OEJ18979.1 hypothetical protein A9496_05790 [Brachyspira hampsonii]